MRSRRGDIARRLLSRAGFRRLLLVRFVGQFGDGLLQVGLASFVFFSPERATTPERIAAGFAVLLLPFSLVGPFAGVLLDRWPRQQILLIANLTRAVMLIALAAQAVLGSETVGFYATALAVLGVNRFILAALSASLPHVVRRPRLVAANAIATTTGTVITVVGATVGVALRQSAGGDDAATALLMLTAAVVCALAGLAALRFARPALGPHPPTTVRWGHAVADVLRGMMAGLAHLAARSKATRALTVMTAHRFLYGVATVVAILLFRNTLFPGDTDAAFAGLGAVVAAAGLGVLVGAVATPPATRRYGSVRWTAFALVTAAAAQLVFGLTFQMWGLIAGSFLLGAVAQAIKIGVDATLQRQIEDRFRGRTFTVYDVLFNVAYVAAAAIAAMILPASGESPIVVVLIAVGYLALAIWYARPRAD